MIDDIAMASDAVKEGITAIIATLLHKNEKYTSPKSPIIAAISQFSETLQDRGVPLGRTRSLHSLATYR
jgi:tyrosine-protein phosphatase YwqE